VKGGLDSHRPTSGNSLCVHLAFVDWSHRACHAAMLMALSCFLIVVLSVTSSWSSRRRRILSGSLSNRSAGTIDVSREDPSEETVLYARIVRRATVCWALAISPRFFAVLVP